MLDRTAAGALRALVRLELVRALPVLGRGLAMGLVVGAVLLVTGAATLPRMAFLLAVVGGAPVVAVPMNALRDKLEGGLDFLCLLPVPPDTHVQARFAALGLLAVPGAIMATVATALVLAGDVPGLLTVRALGGTFLALAVAFVVAGALLCALILRFELSRTTHVPILLLGAVLVLDHLQGRYVPDPLGAWLSLAQRSWFLPAASLTVLVLTGALLGAAFALARSGVARYTPSRDRITW